MCLGAGFPGYEMGKKSWESHKLKIPPSDYLTSLLHISIVENTYLVTINIVRDGGGGVPL